MNNLGLAIQWREDVDAGDMIVKPGYTRQYLAFIHQGRISQQELDGITSAINVYYESINSEKRVVNQAGELIPASQLSGQLGKIPAAQNS